LTAIINCNAISMEMITIKGKDKETRKDREIIMRTKDAVEKIAEAAVDPETNKHWTVEQARFAMFANPQAISQVLAHVNHLSMPTYWTTGGPDIKEDIDVGSLVGKRVRIEQREYRNGFPVETSYLEGVVSKETPETYLEEDGDKRPSTALIVRLADGRRRTVHTRYAGWQIAVGDEWVDPHDYAERVQEERESEAAGEHLMRRRSEVHVRPYRRRA
jgi:hypothetical protein